MRWQWPSVGLKSRETVVNDFDDVSIANEHPTEQVRYRRVIIGDKQPRRDDAAGLAQIVMHQAKPLWLREMKASTSRGSRRPRAHSLRSSA
jgi:hypothetical protein